MLGWDPDDRAKAIAYHIHEASRCRHCGTRRAEWGIRGGPDWRPAYVAATDRCYGCEAIETLRAAIQHEPMIGKGVHVILKPNPDQHARR